MCREKEKIKVSVSHPTSECSKLAPREYRRRDITMWRGMCIGNCVGRTGTGRSVIQTYPRANGRKYRF